MCGRCGMLGDHSSWRDCLRDLQLKLADVKSSVTSEDRSSSVVVAMCARCGMPGTHGKPAECIDAFRSEIARHEIRADAQRSVRPTPPGGYRLRKDHRFVILDGLRMHLTAAARRLGITAAALHLRIVRRTQNPAYQDTDVRGVGADKCRLGGPARLQKNLIVKTGINIFILW